MKTRSERAFGRKDAFPGGLMAGRQLTDAERMVLKQFETLHQYGIAEQIYRYIERAGVDLADGEEKNFAKYQIMDAVEFDVSAKLRNGIHRDLRGLILVLRKLIETIQDEVVDPNDNLDGLLSVVGAVEMKIEQFEGVIDDLEENYLTPRKIPESPVGEEQEP